MANSDFDVDKIIASPVDIKGTICDTQQGIVYTQPVEPCLHQPYTHPKSLLCQPMCTTPYMLKHMGHRET
jgi:hypothetical protein